MSPTEAAAQHIRLYVLLVLPMVMILLPRLGSFTRSIPFVYGLFRRGIQMFSPEHIALAWGMYIPWVLLGGIVSRHLWVPRL